MGEESFPNMIIKRSLHGGWYLGMDISETYKVKETNVHILSKSQGYKDEFWEIGSMSLDIWSKTWFNTRWIYGKLENKITGIKQKLGGCWL